MKLYIEGVWKGLSWGCSYAGRPSVQIALRDPGANNGKKNPPSQVNFRYITQLLERPVSCLKIAHIHAASFDERGYIAHVGNPVLQETVFPLVTHLLENLEIRVIVHVNNHTDISMLDPRANIILVPEPPGNSREAVNYWPNLNYLSEDGEILFILGTEQEYRWMKEIIIQYSLTERFTVHVLIQGREELKRYWSRRVIKESLQVHLLSQVPFTPIPLDISQSRSRM